jgi:hypothetical protein
VHVHPGGVEAVGQTLTLVSGATEDADGERADVGQVGHAHPWSRSVRLL